jgi:PAS domain S-box-containing protein
MVGGNQQERRAARAPPRPDEACASARRVAAVHAAGCAAALALAAAAHEALRGHGPALRAAAWMAALAVVAVTAILLRRAVGNALARERREGEARAAAALSDTEERLALAMEAAGLGMFHAVPYGPMAWSPRCREIFGVGDAEIPDFEAFLRLVHPDDRERVRAAALRWTDPAGDGRYQDAYRCLRADGTLRWVAASGRARFAEVDGARRPVLLVGALLDVTDQKAAQAQLMQADRLASVGLLAAGVAHEVNNPLSYVLGALDFLQERFAAGAPRGSDPEVLAALGDARTGAERVRQVVRDLRTFSGSREERRGRVRLEVVVESALRIAANELRHRARVVREFGPVPGVLGDEARLGQVVLNLLVNAAQALPGDRPSAQEIRVVLGTDPAGHAVLEVRDTGPGISPEVADRIFDPFFTTKPPGVGTGLGLSICRNIVLGLGGEISAVPRHGGGAVLRVRLPPAPPAEPAAPPDGPAPRLSPPAPAAAPGRRGSVLVVDDEPFVAAAVRRVLEREHDVTVHTRAEDALAAIEGGARFDAIVCDLMMPGMTGMELHAALERAAPEQADRLVVLTGGAFTAAAREFLERVPVPRAEKPVAPDALLGLVREQVG